MKVINVYHVEEGHEVFEARRYRIRRGVLEMWTGNMRIYLNMRGVKEITVTRRGKWSGCVSLSY